VDRIAELADGHLTEYVGNYADYADKKRRDG
jgi:hypothetical protein